MTADEAYGKDGKFRGWLEQRRVGYVVAVAEQPGRRRRRRELPRRRADRARPGQAWKRRSCGNGSKGPRVYDWAAATLPEDGTEPPGWSRYLLVRRSLTRERQRRAGAGLLPVRRPGRHRRRGADPGRRGPLGRRGVLPERAKNETGLDHYQVRRYDAWYRHVTLAMLAHAYLPSPRRTPQKPWQRPHPGHARRGPPSPGTPDHPGPQPAPPPGPGPPGEDTTSTRPEPATTSEDRQSITKYCCSTSTPAVDRDLVAEAPRTVGRADEIDLRQRGRPFLLRLPESADGGNP